MEDGEDASNWPDIFYDVEPAHRRQDYAADMVKTIITWYAQAIESNKCEPHTILVPEYTLSSSEK